MCSITVIIFNTFIFPRTVISFELTTAEYFQKEEPNALMEVLITKSDIQFANPVYLSIIPLIVGDALSRGVISRFDAENPFSPNRASEYIILGVPITIVHLFLVNVLFLLLYNTF